MTAKTTLDEEEPVALTAAEEAWLAPSLAQAARGEFATSEEVAAVLARPGS